MVQNSQQNFKDNTRNFSTMKIDKIDLKSKYDKITQAINYKKKLHKELKKKQQKNILKEILQNDVNRTLDIYE